MMTFDEWWGLGPMGSEDERKAAESAWHYQQEIIECLNLVVDHYRHVIEQEKHESELESKRIKALEAIVGAMTIKGPNLSTPFAPAAKTIIAYENETEKKWSDS